MKVAIMGYGTIGSGVAEILRDNRDIIARRAGVPLELKYVLDLRDFEGDPVADKIVHDYKTIAEDKEVEMVVETMGGVEPAYTLVRAMLEAGKHVTTSNKALVADKGAELIRIARENKVNFMFEASVGGGIPIIRPLNQCLTGDVIDEITGIVNGTTNYMMTKMANEGSDFDDVLREAQANGFAEKDPTADIEGYDACRKIAILTSLVAGRQVDYNDIPTEGITNIDSDDMKYARAMGRAIKLLARSKAIGETYVAQVAPYMIAPEHPLYGVNGVFNAIFVKGNMLGDSMFYGSGAGKLPTASAVVGDLVAMAKHVDKNIFVEWDEEKLELGNASQNVGKYFVRAKATKEEVEKVFFQVDYVDAGIEGEVAFVTVPMTEADYKLKAEELSSVIKMIRIY